MLMKINWFYVVKRKSTKNQNPFSSKDTFSRQNNDFHHPVTTLFGVCTLPTHTQKFNSNSVRSFITRLTRNYFFSFQRKITLTITTTTTTKSSSYQIVCHFAFGLNKSWRCLYSRRIVQIGLRYKLRNLIQKW